MKYSIWCHLFGHDWLRKSLKSKDEDGILWSLSPSDWCQRCGLSKKEVGITR